MAGVGGEGVSSGQSEHARGVRRMQCLTIVRTPVLRSGVAALQGVHWSWHSDVWRMWWMCGCPT